MKRFLLNLGAAIVLALGVNMFTVGILSPNLPPTVGKPDVHKTASFSLPDAQSVRISNQNGAIRVRVHQAASMKLDAEITAFTQDAPPEFLADSLIEIHSIDDAVDVSAASSLPGIVDLHIDYTLFVPPGKDVVLESTNGNVWVSKGCGQVDIKGQNTDIEVVEPEGPVTASSTNGRIRVVDAPAGATIETVNGNIYAHMLGGNLEAATTNGAVVAHLLRPDIDECRLDSKNGGITLVLNDQGSVTVEAATVRGLIRSDWPMIAPQETPRSLHATIGQGHTRVQMNTLNGNIWIAQASQ